VRLQLTEDEAGGDGEIMKAYGPGRVEVNGVVYEIRVLFTLEQTQEEPVAQGALAKGGTSPSEPKKDALCPGDIVRHRLSPGLLGRIVEIGHRRAKIELLAWPPDDWWRTWGRGPAPVMVENLVRAE
jgi:hypothetical protein